MIYQPECFISGGERRRPEAVTSSGGTGSGEGTIPGKGRSRRYGHHHGGKPVPPTLDVQSGRIRLGHRFRLRARGPGTPSQNRPLRRLRLAAPRTSWNRPSDLCAHLMTLGQRFPLSVHVDKVWCPVAGVMRWVLCLTSELMAKTNKRIVCFFNKGKTH